VNFSRFFLSGLALCAGSACTDPAGPSPKGGPNQVRIQSDPGDPVGSGRSYEYTQANAEIVLNRNLRMVEIMISGDERWQIHLRPPYQSRQLVPGAYEGARSLPTTTAVPSIIVLQEGSSGPCSEASGRFTIEKVEYTADSLLAAVDATFEQRCSGATGSLRGTIHWRWDDATKPPGPAPIPSSLWRPSPAATPSNGSYIYLVSEPGDYMGQGGSWTYALPPSSLRPTVIGRVLLFGYVGDWIGRIDLPSSVTRPEVGYYAGLQASPYFNPARGMLQWHLTGRSCDTTSGWLAIDAISYSSTGTLTALDLRLEQRCNGSPGVLRGLVHVGS
jgi:hypothetical protein